MIGGDFNEIKNNEDKREGRRRQESNFSNFRNFILDMEMGDIRFMGETFTWVNNKKGEGYNHEMLDKYFGSAEWMLQFDKAEVIHFLRQTSDYSGYQAINNLNKS